MEIIKQGFKQGLPPILLGLFVGAIGGWVGVIFSNENQSPMAIAANFYLGMLLLLPLVLLAVVEVPEPDSEALTAWLTKSLPIALLAAVVAVVGATALFLVPATNLIVILKGLDPLEVSRALQLQLGWLKPLLLLVVTVLTSLGKAFWLYRRRL